MDRVARDYSSLLKYKDFLLEKYGDLHNFSDPELVSKLQNIHQTMVHLRYMLSMEKQQLEKEKYATHSLISLQQMYNSRNSFSGSSYPLNIDWSNYVVTPNYNNQFRTDPTYAYNAHYARGEEMKEKLTNRYIGMYKGHLEDVVKMCDKELKNMEHKLGELKKVRRDFDCHEIRGPLLQKKQKKSKSSKMHNYAY